MILIFGLHAKKVEILVETAENKYLKENESYESSNDSHILLTSLKDRLVRFKLLGPLSTTILGNVLKTMEKSSNGLMEKYYENQSELWNQINFSLKNPNDLVGSTVIGLLVRDPRLTLPKKKQFNAVKEKNDKINSFKNNQGK